MNLNKYDYYGNYENNNYTLNINDIQRKQMEKKKKRLEIYNRLLQNTYKRIKNAVEKDETYCLYQCPEYITGYPIYNLTECVLFILKHLKEKGFQCRYVHPFVIFVSWNYQPLAIENESQQRSIYAAPPQSQPERENKKPSILEQLDLKYKSIEDYDPDKFM